MEFKIFLKIMEFKMFLKRPALFCNPQDIDFFKAYFGYPKDNDFVPLKGFRRFEAKYIGSKEVYYLVPQQLLPLK